MPKTAPSTTTTTTPPSIVPGQFSATSTPPTATTTPPAGGTFPATQTTSTASEASTASSVANLTPAQFASDYNVSTSELPTYIDSKTGKLNNNAADLAWYLGLSQEERQTVQQGMVNVGILTAAQATGEQNTTTTGAFKALVGQAAAQGSDVTTLLANANQNGIAPIQSQISAEATKANEEIQSETPVAAQLENPTTLSATITSAFDRALGYAPDADQIKSFISQIQGQDVNNAEAGNNANKAQAQSDLDRAKSEESALNKLGPDGIDSFLSAYQAAINGTGAAGVNTPQGPQTGTAVGSSASPASGPLVAGGVTGTPGQSTTNETPNAPSFGQRVEALVGKVGPTPPTVTHTGEATGFSYSGAPAQPQINNGPQYGGIYALSPKLWTEAQAAFPGAKKYATAGQAPQAVQTAAVTQLSQNLFDKNQSWSDVAIELAGGDPKGAVLGSKTNVQTFANNIAASVNSQIESVQSQVNSAGPAVTTKVTAPDANAEASQAAKTADPVGYYAANYASAGSILDQMLSGAPQMFDQSSADSFAGPVDTAAAASTPAAQAPAQTAPV